MANEEAARQFGMKNIATARGGQDSKWPYYLVIIFLVLEYGRPQSWFKPLEYLHMSMIVGLLLMMFLAKRSPINLTHPQTKLYILLLILMVAHIPFAENNFWAFNTTQSMFLTFIEYLSIIHFIDTFEKFKKMMAAWIWIHLFLGISGIMLGGRGIGGFMGDENDFALVLNMGIPFAFFVGMAAHTTKEKVRLFFTTAVLVLCVTATFSRGGFLGMVSVAGFCWVKSPRKIMSLVLAFILLCVVAALVPEKYWDERIGSIADEASNQSGTGGQRLYTWGLGWQMFLDHPIVGVGPGNFPWNVKDYEPPEGHGGKSFGGRAAHSLYFTLFPELGMVGVIIFLLMLKASWQDRRVISSLAKRSFQLPRNATLVTERGQKTNDYELAYYCNLAISASVVAYLVTGTFITVLYYPSLWLLIAFGVALKNVVVKMDETVPAVVSGREGIGRYATGRVFPNRIRGVVENQ